MKRDFDKSIRLALFVILLMTLPGPLFGADIFGFYAPPGSQTLNAAFDREGVEQFYFQIEHEGVGISSWFVTIGLGQAPDYITRIMNQGTDELNYQVYLETPPSAKVVKAVPETLDANNTVTSSDFAAVAAVQEIVAFSVYFHIPDGQFVPAGEYNDSLVVTLYTGTYAAPIQVDQFTLSVTGRMAEITDIYMDQEPGIRYMDLTATQTDKLIAVVNERSNASLGYTVTLTSANFAAVQAGHTEPYFQHESDSSATLTYSLGYDGSAVTGWSGGAAVITDTASTTAGGTNWQNKNLTLSYTGDSTIPSGYYEDRLTVTIQAK